MREKGMVDTAVSFANGTATLATHVDGVDIKVSVKTRKTDDSPYKEGFRWGGEGSSAAPTMITLVVVQRGAERLFVPLSAYSDLGDPRKIFLKSRTVGFELDIFGGDAGVAYNATLIFENGWLIRRRVAHGEFPDEAWEEPQYAYNTLNN